MIINGVGTNFYQAAVLPSAQAQKAGGTAVPIAKRFDSFEPSGNSLRKMLAELDEPSYDSEEKTLSAYQCMILSLAGEAVASKSDAALYWHCQQEGGDSERLSEIISNAANRECVISYEQYNKCASIFAEGNGTDPDEVTLSKEEYEKLFANVEQSGENFAERCTERASRLFDMYDKLDKMYKTLKK